MENIGFELAVKVSNDELRFKYFVPWRCFSPWLCQMGCESHTAQEVTLDFILCCLHKGCGPSESCCPVDEMKTQSEATRMTVLR